MVLNGMRACTVLWGLDCGVRNIGATISHGVDEFPDCGAIWYFHGLLEIALYSWVRVSYCIEKQRQQCFMCTKVELDGWGCRDWKVMIWGALALSYQCTLNMILWCSQLFGWCRGHWIVWQGPSALTRMWVCHQSYQIDYLQWTWREQLPQNCLLDAWKGLADCG